jgi:hypothetical protein
VERHGSDKNNGVSLKMSARMYLDVNILLTLDFEQKPLLRKCTIFKESVQGEKIDCYLLSTVKTIRNGIAKEVVEAGGNALRGLWHHLCMYKGAGLPYILSNAVLEENDLPSIQTYFRQKIKEQKRDLAKSQVQIIEVWAIDVFHEMETDRKGKIPLMDYLQHLSLYLSEYYVEAKNALLRTESDLRLIEEEIVNANLASISDLVAALNQVGFNDKEDMCHLASLSWLKKNKGYTPIFATADRKLYEQKDIVYDRIGVIVEDPLYAIRTYRSTSQKKSS